MAGQFFMSERSARTERLLAEFKALADCAGDPQGMVYILLVDGHIRCVCCDRATAEQQVAQLPHTQQALAEVSGWRLTGHSAHQ